MIGLGVDCVAARILLFRVLRELGNVRFGAVLALGLWPERCGLKHAERRVDLPRDVREVFPEHNVQRVRDFLQICQRSQLASMRRHVQLNTLLEGVVDHH